MCLKIIDSLFLEEHLFYSGMWYNILQFLNICGVVSNAFLIAFTSQWGHGYSDKNKLWIVIIFEVGHYYICNVSLTL